jgi:hypothetical protein
MKLPKSPAEIQALDADSRARVAAMVNEVLSTGGCTVTKPDGQPLFVEMLSATFFREVLRYTLATKADAPATPDEALLAATRARFGGSKLPELSAESDAASGM